MQHKHALLTSVVYALTAHHLPSPDVPACLPGQAQLLSSARHAACSPHPLPLPPLPSPPQTYTAPQSAGQYRYIMGGGTFVGTGDYLDEAVPGGADKNRMTQAQVGCWLPWQLQRPQLGTQLACCCAGIP